MTTLDLYAYAQKNDVAVYDFHLEGRKALSVPLEDGVCAVAMDTLRMSSKDEKLALAHELGHCMTHTFYNEKTPCVTRSRCETRAMKWAVKHLVDEGKLRRAIRAEMQVWEIAELFEVDELTIEQAVNLYFYNHI